MPWRPSCFLAALPCLARSRKQDEPVHMRRLVAAGVIPSQPQVLCCKVSSTEPARGTRHGISAGCVEWYAAAREWQGIFTVQSPRSCVQLCHEPGRSGWARRAGAQPSHRAQRPRPLRARQRDCASRRRCRSLLPLSHPRHRERESKRLARKSSKATDGRKGIL